MIKKFLRNIRQKPTAVREQYAFWIACTLTSIVAFVWLTTKIDLFGISEAPDEVTVGAPDTLSNFMDGAQNQVDAAKQEIQNMLPAFASSSVVSPTSSTTPDAEAEVAPTSTRQEIRIATTTSSSTN